MSTWLEYHEEPVTLHSGGRSHWLIDADMIFVNDDLRRAVIEYWCSVIGYKSVHNVIVAIPEGGVKWAEELAKEQNLGWTNLVEVLRETWAGKYIHAGENERLIVVDDVSTTGASLVTLLPHSDVRLCVVDRSERGLRSAGAWAHIPLPLLDEAP